MNASNSCIVEVALHTLYEAHYAYCNALRMKPLFALCTTSMCSCKLMTLLQAKQSKPKKEKLFESDPYLKASNQMTDTPSTDMVHTSGVWTVARQTASTVFYTGLGPFFDSQIDTHPGSHDRSTCRFNEIYSCLATSERQGQVHPRRTTHNAAEAGDDFRSPYTKSQDRHRCVTKSSRLLIS